MQGKVVVVVVVGGGRSMLTLRQNQMVSGKSMTMTNKLIAWRRTPQQEPHAPLLVCGNSSATSKQKQCSPSLNFILDKIISKIITCTR